MTTYRGRRGPDGAAVTADERTLPLRRNLMDHSPDGFEWGYEGSGPAQLALALVVDVVRNPRRAVAVHQGVKRRLVAGLRGDEWELTDEDVAAAVAEAERDRVRPLLQRAGPRDDRPPAVVARELRREHPQLEPIPLFTLEGYVRDLRGDEGPGGPAS